MDWLNLDLISASEKSPKVLMVVALHPLQKNIPNFLDVMNDLVCTVFQNYLL